MTGIYYALLSCMFIAFAAILYAINSGKLKNLIKPFAAIAISAFTFIMSAIPSLMFWLKNGRTVVADSRAAQNAARVSEDMGLKLIQLFIPDKEHRFSLFSRITATNRATQIIFSRAPFALPHARKNTQSPIYARNRIYQNLHNSNILYLPKSPYFATHPSAKISDIYTLTIYQNLRTCEQPCIQTAQSQRLSTSVSVVRKESAREVRSGRPPPAVRDAPHGRRGRTSCR